MKPRIPALIIAALFLASSSLTFAHAFLDRAEPKVGSRSTSAPTEVKIWFTQAVEPAFSRIKVLDAQGHQVDKKDSHVDPDDKKLLIVSLEHLDAGSYKVEWNVISVDTHKTKGDFKFEVSQ